MLRVWVVLATLFCAGGCAEGLPLSRVDLGGSIGRGGTCRHLNNLQALAAVADDDALRAVAAVDKFRQAGVQFVDSRLVHRVDVHSVGKSIVAEEHGPVKTFPAQRQPRTDADSPTEVYP
jgi:hypothetical protein